MYFNGMGRAETTRMLFYMGGVDFQDVRLTREQWMELKPSMLISFWGWVVYTKSLKLTFMMLLV